MWISGINLSTVLLANCGKFLVLTIICQINRFLKFLKTSGCHELVFFWFRLKNCEITPAFLNDRKFCYMLFYANFLK
jgi:hypothetical protein